MSAARISVADALTAVTSTLRAGGVSHPLNEAELILRDALRVERSYLYLNRERLLESDETRSIFATAERRRATRQPIQHILGRQAFRFIDLKVTPEVFIPRPETELLLDEAFSYLDSLNEPAEALDIGTGTGAIALSLAAERANVLVHASDACEAALGVARHNAEQLKLKERVRFYLSDLFAGLGFLRGTLDLIITNPPYIPTAEIDKLSVEVRSEPAKALDGGADGLRFYRSIIEQAPEYLKPGGALVLEIGYGQRHALEAMMRATGLLISPKASRDNSGIYRIVSARRA